MLYSCLPVSKEILKVSKLCFGSLCMGPLQSNLSVKDGAGIISRAFSLGVNFIDTAQIYGTYPYIRAALELNRVSGKNKDKIIISTKTYAHTRKLAKEALDEALRELGTDCIDIFMLHEQESIYTLYGHIEALEYLFEQKKSGTIKAVGISTHHVAGVRGAVEFNKTHKEKLDAIHPMYNMTGLGIIPESASTEKSAVLQMGTALAEAKQSGFFIFSMKPLGGGNLFAQAGEALGFSAGKDFIDSIAVGMKSGSEVDANVSFFETGKFTGEYYKNYSANAAKKTSSHRRLVRRVRQVRRSMPAESPRSFKWQSHMRLRQVRFMRILFRRMRLLRHKNNIIIVFFVFKSKGYAGI